METERAVKNGQSRDSGNIWGYKTKDEDKQKKRHVYICPVTRFPSSNKTECHDITEIFLKLVSITLTIHYYIIRNTYV